MSESGAYLTPEAIQAAAQKMAEGDRRHMAEMGRRMGALASLRLDWDAMATDERALIEYGVTVDAVHPKDGERLRAIVEKYRRDGRDHIEGGDHG